jgi:hypothetical protein
VDGRTPDIDVAAAADGELVNGGVVLAGQVAGAAVAWGVVPGAGGGGADGGVVATVVVVLAVGVEQGLQVGQGGGGGLGGEPFLEGLVVALDLAAGLGLTGQSKIIVWITVRARAGLVTALAARAFEAAELFFVAADALGDGFEAVAQLVDLHGEASEGGGVAAAGAVVVDERAQVGPAVESGAADAGADCYLAEGDGLPGGGQFVAGCFDAAELVGVSCHRPG